MSAIAEAVDASAPVSGGAPDGGMGDYIDGLKDQCGFIISKVDSLVETITGWSLLEALFKPIAGDFNTVASMQLGWGKVGESLGGVGDNYRQLAGQLPGVWSGPASQAAQGRLGDIAHMHAQQQEASAHIADQLGHVVEVAQATAEVVAAALNFIDSVIQELLLDAASGPFGWVKGALTAPGKARKLISLIHRGVQAIEKFTHAVKAVVSVLKYLNAHVLAPAGTVTEPEEDEAPTSQVPADPRTVLDIAVGRMDGHGVQAHKVWLPPLGDPDTLDALMPDLVEDPELGLVSPTWRDRGGLRVPLGTVDRPREQRRDVLQVNLAGAAGHIAVVGGPRSGKSTLLRTIVCSLALTTTPGESQFYVLDFGGGTFAPMTGLPHVAGVATRSEPDVCRRVFAEVQGIVDRREAYFREQGIDSIETYRARRRDGEADDGYGDVFLVVDGWSTLRADFENLEMELQALAQRGLTFGLHVVAGASRWADFRAATRDVFGTRLELRLGDPLDSEVDRKVAQLVPTGRPGRGLTTSKLHFLGALPRIDGQLDVDAVGVGVEDLVRRVSDAWHGPVGPKLRLLPEQVGLDRVHDQAGVSLAEDTSVYLAVDERDLAPVRIDVEREPHLLAFGDSGSGKSTLLRGYLREVMRSRSAEEAQIVVVDYRRSLLGEVPEDYLVHYLTSATQAQPALVELAAYLEGRLPGPDVTPDQLRTRSWWTGADVFVVVDDYDLVSTQAGSPVAPLVPLLAQAHDVGLHLALARRSGGAARALYEPVIQSLRDLAMPGLLLSGSPDEGALLGTAKPRQAVPGRAQLITRDRGVEVVQAVWTEPTS